MCQHLDMDAVVVPELGLSRLSALRALRREPIALLEHAASLGDVVHASLPRVEVFVVNHPDLVWDVMATGNRDFRKSPAAQNIRRVLGDGLLTSEGDLHRQQRRLIQPIFHHDRIDAYGDAMVAQTERVADELVDDAALDMHQLMAALTLDIVARTLFAADVGGRDADAVARALREILSQFGRQFSPWFPITQRLPLPATRRFDRSVAVFDRLVYSLIASRRRTGATGDDVLSLLLAAQEHGEGMTDRQVRDEAITLFLAGHETTSNALTWTWWLLSGHPEAEERLHAELDQTLDRGAPPTAADLARLPFTTAILSESMRLRPPAWAIGRQAVADHDLGGVRLSVGSVAVVSPWLLHHDPRWWSEPNAFRPERWLLPDADRPRHAYMPFGGGPRLCVGEGFAWMEAGLLLATLARRWRFTLEPSARVELQPVVTLRPRHGMPMRAWRRGAR